MNWKAPLILIILAGAAVFGVLKMQQRSHSANAPAHEAKLVPGLEKQVNTISGVRIRTAGNQLVANLKRTDNGWVVTDKHDYPADLGKLRQLLLGIAQAHVLETKTADPKLYSKLDVTAVKHKDAKGVEVEIDGLKQPIKLIVGKAAPRSSDESYVRLADQAHSLLIDTKLDVPRKIAKWLRQPLLDLPADQVQQVVIRHPDGSTLTVQRKDRKQGDLEPAKMPPGRQLKYTAAADPIGSVLSGLQFQDVLPVSQLDPSKQKNAVSAHYRLFNGMTLTFTAFKHDGHDYAHVRVGFDQDQYQRFARAKKSATKSQSGQAKQTQSNAAGKQTDKNKDKSSAQAVAARAKALDQRLKGWVYEIASYKFNNLTKTLDDLLKPVKKASKSKPAAAQPPAAGSQNPQKPASSSQAPAPSGQ